MRRIAAAMVLLGLETGIVVALHLVGKARWLRLPDDDAFGWLATNPPVETIAALLRPLALVAAIWLLATTILYCMASAAGSPAATKLRRVTLPAVRRVIDGAVVIGLSTVITSGPSPALAVETPVPHLLIEATAQQAPDPAPAAAAALERLGWLEPVEKTEITDIAVAEPATKHVVRRGDNLWSIAAQHLAATRGASSKREIVDYWRAVITANEGRLRSGDPDLIFPGELIELPPPSIEGPS